MMGKERKTSCIEIKDGIIDNNEFSKRHRLLWVLKEANKGIEGNNLCRFLRDEKRIKSYLRWKSTYGSVIKVSYGLLKGFPPFSEAEKIEDKIGILRKIAVININKKAGGSTNNPSALRKAYKKYKPKLLHQIKRIKPKVIIFGNTFQFFKEDPANQFVFPSEKGIVWSYKWKNNNNALCLWTYHPGQYKEGVTHKKYYETIIERVRKDL